MVSRGSIGSFNRDARYCAAKRNRELSPLAARSPKLDPLSNPLAMGVVPLMESKPGTGRAVTHVILFMRP